MIVFIGCTKLKADKRCEAEQLYKSTLFKYALSYAKKLKPRKIYILSAKHGVLELNDIVSPYNETLNTKTKKEKQLWAYKCYYQLTKKNINFEEEVVWLCGENYREYLIRKFTNNKIPIKGLGIGEQLKFYKENVR